MTVRSFYDVAPEISKQVLSYGVNRDTARNLAEKIATAGVNFARTGNPNQPG